MNINLPPGANNPLDSLDFQPTDLEDAREALNELPAGVEQLGNFDPGYWAKRRRDITGADKALTGNTIDWLMHLPPGSRPQQLCERFPRLANLIAEAWADPRTAFAELNNLLIDKRKGRSGFPPEVRDELRSLCDMLCGP